MISNEELVEMLRERAQAKVTRDYAKSDEIRTKLEALGVKVHDATKSWSSSDGRVGTPAWQYVLSPPSLPSPPPPLPSLPLQPPPPTPPTPMPPPCPEYAAFPRAAPRPFCWHPQATPRPPNTPHLHTAGNTNGPDFFTPSSAASGGYGGGYAPPPQPGGAHEVLSQGWILGKMAEREKVRAAEPETSR